MSIQLSTTFGNGLTAAVAVHKVLGAAFNEPDVLHFDVGVFVDLAKSQDATTPPVEHRTFRKTGFDPAAAQNIHTQAYNHLKTLPEYAGYLDV
mgnify:CR=1 FL=1